MCRMCVNPEHRALRDVGKLYKSGAVSSYMIDDIDLETHEELKKAFVEELKQLGLD